MCRKCVEDGFITEDQHQQLMNGANPDDVLDETQKARLQGADDGVESIRVMAGQFDELPKFIQDMLKSRIQKEESETPDEKATSIMDTNVAAVLDYVGDQYELILGEFGEITPAQMNRFAETVAGQIMFRINDASVAFSLVLLAVRYKSLLDQWSTLYVNAARDVDDLVTDLDQAKTPESKSAVSKAGKVDPKSVRLGLYL